MENAWKSAARHWWERMRQAERERDELLQKLEELRGSLARETAVRLAHESAAVMKGVYAQPSGIPEKAAKDFGHMIRTHREERGLTMGQVSRRLGVSVVRVSSIERGEEKPRVAEVESLRSLLHMEPAAVNAAVSEAFPEPQPSGISGEFADLAARIAKADAKHPRDLPDTSHEINAERAVSRLRLARARVELEAFPAWDNALECEVAEASAEIALGNPERLADELLDVATVAMRWRRAVLERGKR